MFARVHGMGLTLAFALALGAAACGNQGSDSRTGTGGAGPNAVPSLGTGGSAGSSGGTNASNAAAATGTNGAAGPGNGSGGSGGGTGGATSGNAASGTGGTGGANIGGGVNATRPPAPVPGASPTSLAAQTVSVSMTDANQFSPSTIDVPRGQTVVWTNTGRTPHTVTDDASKASNKANAVMPQGAQAWDSGTVGPGATFSHVFDTPGQYTYFCSLHEGAGMVARINVSG
jgi:plastocyanin